MTEKEVRESLLEAFVIKSTVKQKVYENTLQTFTILKKVLKQLEKDYLSIIKNQVAATSLPIYKDRGPFECEFKIGSDLLIFSMHSNVFEFDDKHPVWKTAYINIFSCLEYDEKKAREFTKEFFKAKKARCRFITR
ncbi:MAG: hypothetical protein EOM73_06585 [Bacteroidia bacterium]|nr:hypothetical protein [Bacteroidia bacterium]